MPPWNARLRYRNLRIGVRTRYSSPADLNQLLSIGEGGVKRAIGKIGARTRGPWNKTKSTMAFGLPSQTDRRSKGMDESTPIVGSGSDRALSSHTSSMTLRTASGERSRFAAVTIFDADCLTVGNRDLILRAIISSSVFNNDKNLGKCASVTTSIWYVRDLEPLITVRRNCRRLAGLRITDRPRGRASTRSP